jgi:hypothetical protein
VELAVNQEREGEKMKKAALFLLAVVLTLGVAGCGGGGDDDDGPTGPGGTFEFNGKWAYEGIVTTSNSASMPVGTRITDIATITASGTNFTLDFPGNVPPFVGTCDPEAGTFQAKVVYKNITAVIAGHSTGSSSMEGDETWTEGKSRIVINWTMTLDSRQAATPGSISRDAFVEAFVRAAGATH